MAALLANPHHGLARIGRSMQVRKGHVPPRHAERAEWRRWWRSLPHGDLDPETAATALLMGATRDGEEPERSARLEWCCKLLRKELEASTRPELPKIRELVARAHRVDDALHDIVGDSRPIRRVREAAWRAAFGRRLSRSHESLLHASPVLILGETGTGKELVAQAICEASAKSTAVHLAATREELVNDELFGHEKGAFTGARGQRIGVLERYHGGAVFLDEVGELPASTQVALLRCLQEGKVRRAGGDEPVEASPRVIAATHRDLGRLVEHGRFRDDLYYRLSCLEITVPPLRDRKDDIPLIAQEVLRQLGLLDELGAEVDKRLQIFLELTGADHPWYGNVRELRTFVQRAAVGLGGPLSVARQPAGLMPQELVDATWSLDEVKRWYARHALEVHETRTKAADQLDVTRVTLNKYLREVS